jgi:outer membrane protein OmpA-like peptidoglycan-associated protein
VNLTGTDIKFPRELTSISGMVILFSYDVAPKLTEPDDVKLKAPKVSLGVYPTALSVQANEGSLVEFSVFKSPAGQVTWKFEIFSVRADNALMPLQKIDDVGPVCRQSYWNGRKNFFGVPYPSGKYMFSITATDVEGRESNLRRFLVIKPSPEEMKALAAGKVRPQAQSRELFKAEPAEASGAKKPVFKKGKAVPGSKKAGFGKGKPAAVPGKKSVNAAAEGAAPGAGKQASGEQNPTEFSGQVSYKIYFREETAVVTPSSEKRLAQVAETLNYYPMAQVKLIGYAYSGEANPESMAQNRVDSVATRLNGKYNIGTDRMDTSTQISDAPKSMVEIKMLGKE